MIQLVLCFLLVWCLIKVLDKDHILDAFSAIAFVLVPAFILFGGSFLIAQTGLAVQSLLLFELAYFFVPLLTLKAISEYSWGRIVAFSFGVLVSNFVAQFVVFMLLS